jgi:UDP-N-acetylmuramoyl-L-alanyl-D-glutamate--2,6-diaminopimelate ligase
MFTNLTQDHLDFHENLENYFLAKRKLFTEHLQWADNGLISAAIGIDDPYGRRLKKELGLKAYGFGLSNDADIRGLNLKTDHQGLSMTVSSPWGSWEQKSPLIGAFNALNILGAITVAGLMGVPMALMVKALRNSQGAPGRLEKITGPKDSLILVDYAHTPGALETALKALSELKPARLITVFGCGGDRDRQKRPLMGQAAGKYSDLTVLTSDNPRTEDALSIINEAKAGLDFLEIPLLDHTLAQSQKGYVVESDRRKAIFLAVSLLKKGDILLIAGKGHEDYQIIQRTKNPFDDRLVAKEAVMMFDNNIEIKAGD